MITVTASMDSAKVRSMFARISADMRDKAIPRALNKTVALAKTQAARQVRSAGYGLKVATIKSQLTITKATPTEQRAVLRANGRPIPLVMYGANTVQEGVSVKVKGARKVIKGAFIAVMPGGHRGVFVRVGDTHKKVVKGKSYWSGLPIKELFGPSVPDAMANQAVQDALAQMITERFPSLLLHEIQYLRR